MPSIELSKLQAVTGPRALSDTDRTTIESRAPDRQTAPASRAGAEGVSLQVGSSFDASSPPVDTDRVAEIRDALRDGSYPLVPAEIADAMIAAQLSFGIDS